MSAASWRGQNISHGKATSDHQANPVPPAPQCRQLSITKRFLKNNLIVLIILGHGLGGSLG